MNDWVTDGYTVSGISPLRECLDKGRCEEGVDKMIMVRKDKDYLITE